MNEGELKKKTITKNPSIMELGQEDDDSIHKSTAKQCKIIENAIKTNLKIATY